MSFVNSQAIALLAGSICLGLIGCSSSSDNNPATSASCPVAAAQAVQICLGVVNEAERACYQNGGTACDVDDADILDAHDALQNHRARQLYRRRFYGPVHRRHCGPATERLPSSI